MSGVVEIPSDVQEALTYLLDGGLVETNLLTDGALAMGYCKVSVSADHAAALCMLAAEAVEARRAPLSPAPAPAGAVEIPGERYPTREEASAAAAVLLRCNGHDLDVWTGELWFDEVQEALRALAALTPEAAS